MNQINGCDQCHTYCRRDNDVSLPTRLLKIDGPDKVALYITKENESARYLCLSHSWGGQQPLTTTTENLNTLKSGISWDTLPRTFQDAVIFTYRLGISFLWIDSLCIIQDDDEDWRNEGGRMADIYENAYLTISATHSDGPSKGLFERTSGDLQIRTVNIWNDPSSALAYQMHVRPRYPHAYADSTCFSLLPLFQRAWVLQEWLLSPRVVHFCPDEVVWVCQTSTACECDHDTGSRTFVNLLYKNLGGRITTRSSTLGDRWHRVVSEFSRRQLTYENDVFPALQGIAKWFEREKKCAYYAGLWQDNIIDDLLWCRGGDLEIEERQTVNRPKQYRAPSWSWASVAGEVHWPFSIFKPSNQEVAKAIATIIPVGDDAFGQINSGVLVIEGPCIDALLSGTLVKELTGSHHFDWKLTIKTRTGDGHAFHTHKSPGNFTMKADSDNIAQELCDAKPSSPVRIIMLATSKDKDMIDTHWGSGSSGQYLVLRRFDEKYCLFERIGILRKNDTIIAKRHDWTTTQDPIHATYTGFGDHKVMSSIVV